MLVRRRELNRLLPRHARRHSLDQTGFIRQQAESPEQLPFKVPCWSAAPAVLCCMLTCAHCVSGVGVVKSGWSERTLLRLQLYMHGGVDAQLLSAAALYDTVEDVGVGPLLCRGCG